MHLGSYGHEIGSKSDTCEFSEGLGRIERMLDGPRGDNSPLDIHRRPSIQQMGGRMTDVGDERRALGWALTGFIAILLVVLADLGIDYRQGVGLLHVASEGVVLALALVGITLLGRRYVRLRRQTEQLESQLQQSREDAERWRREAEEALEGLGEAIDRQFDRWELTPAEREVALFLLKGLSHKKIADIRDVSDRTVRQQAHEVYAKADVSGRAQLSAFFLEDLLVPSLEDRDDEND